MHTHFLFQLSRLVSARQGVYMRKSCPTARATLPSEVRQFAPSSCLAYPKGVYNLLQTVGWILYSNKWKVSSPRVTRGKGCLRYPKLCKWSIISRWHRIPKQNLNHLSLGFLSEHTKSIQRFNACAELLFCPRCPLFWLPRCHYFVVFFTSLSFKNSTN